MDNAIKISIIVPCYNEEDVLPDFYQAIKEVIENKIHLNSYEILFINDGSNDATGTLLKRYHEIDPHIEYLCFSRNFGKESAMYAGMLHASGEYTVIMDADLQHPPEVIIDMYREMQSGKYDMIATRRKNRSTDTKIRAILSKMFYKFMNKISGIDMGNNAMDFRMFNRKAKEAILSITEYNRFSKGIFEWIGFRTHWLEIDINSRKAGKSKWSFRGLFSYSLEGCIAFSTLPLSLASIMGCLCCFVGIAMVIAMVVQAFIRGVEGSGYATIICVILLMGGIQLFCVGILGQYLAKTYLESKNRPKFLLQESSKEDCVHQEEVMFPSQLAKGREETKGEEADEY